MQEALTVEEADPLHHIQSDLKSLPQRQTSLTETTRTGVRLSWTYGAGAEDYDAVLIKR